MEKNIACVKQNNKGEIIETIADYIGVESFAKTLEGLYREVLEDYDNADEIETFLNDSYGCEDYIVSLAWEKAH